MCNTCFAKVNGRSRLTCLEKLPEDAEELVIEPVDNFELIRDLMVDYSVRKSKGT
jgi:succinate dehydrogenase/fumarate reductase-like Fe-S protein